MELWRKIENRTKQMLRSASGCHQLNREMTRSVHVTGRPFVTVLNTQIGSNNLGDNIIMHFSRRILNELLEGETVYEIPSHLAASDQDIRKMLASKAVFVCGTNFISPHMETTSVWNFDQRMIHMKHMILLGVGWGGYASPSMYSRKIFHTLLDNGMPHSVRDQFTADKLKGLGISNVWNTNCVTLWGLDCICPQIPQTKGDRVVVTVTGYMNDQEHDRYLMHVVKELYREVYFWPQGDTDLEYIKTTCNLDGIQVLERSVEAYDRVLALPDIDYVGSRLHGGIYALNHGKRTIIIAVDNRAAEIHRDTNIPVIKSSETKRLLREKILTRWPVQIRLNKSSVEGWKHAVRRKLGQNE